MRDSRIPLIAGLVVLLLAGLAVALTLFNGDTRDNTPRVALDDSPFDKSNNPDPETLPRPNRNRFGNEDTTNQKPDENYPKPVAKPVVKLKVRTSVSGLAVNYADDPAENITLTLLSEDDGEISGPTTVTDADGLFLFDLELNEGDQYFVACLQEDKAITATGAFTISKDEPVEGLKIRIFDPARVYGVVLNGDTNEPLEGVNIKLEGRQDDRTSRLGRLLGRVQTIVSGSDGRFEVESIAPGKYLVRSEKSGWMAHPFNPLTRAMQEVELAEFANLELLPFILVQSGMIEGKVLRKSDKSPIAGATVDLGTVLGGSYDVAVTDDEGKFRFDTVPPGMGGNNGPGADVGGVAVRATAPGYAIASKDLRIRSGQTRTVDLLMDDGCSITGIVSNLEGAPISGARVYYNDNDFLRGGELVAGIALPERTVSTTTDESGRYTLGGLPAGDVTVTASAESFANKDEKRSLTPGTPTEVNFTLEPAGSIAGVVTNERGEPVEGVPIAVFDASGPQQLSFIMKSFFGEELPDRGESTMFPASIRTDAEGRYEVVGLKPSSYVLLANSRDFEKYVSPELEVKPGSVTEHNFSLAVGGTIFGRVYDADGQPESGVPVTCASLMGNDSVRVRTAYTDRSGNYELTGLAPGTYNVVRNTGDFTKLILPNAANQVSVKAGERVEFDIYSQKPGTARIYGRVTLDGQPYAEENLVLLGGGFSGFAANTTKTDASGNYEFRSVTLGTYQIAQSGGRMPSLVRKRVRVDREGDIEINVDFVTVKITGRVELEGGGIPEGGVSVIASPVSPNGADSGNDDENVNDLEMMVFREVQMKKEDGTFEITGLSPGFYRLTARSKKNGMVTRPYLNLRASVNGIVLSLPLDPAKLHGVVKGLDEAENNTPFGLIAAMTIEDENGAPIALGGFDNGVNLTDTKEFTVQNLSEGTFTVTLSLTGYTPITYKNVKLTAGQTTDLTFTFASSGNAKVKLLNEDISVESAFELQYDIVNSKGETFKKRFTFLDFFDQSGNSSQNTDDNSFVIKDLPPETYTITLTLPGFSQAVETFTVVAGETVDVAVQFDKE
ncbi:MAG: carboxypeptidase-like regulatory domain-containing protein [Planctomycetota bacterium]